MDKGTLVLVVGPSGAGKDTLIAAAREQLAGNGRFAFPKRIITRDAVADLEDHGTIDRATFETMRATGDCALCWEAHGLGYILPREIETLLEDSKTIVCNASRQVIGEAQKKYSGTKVVLVTADHQVRAQRLAGRGRETITEIEARLSREPAQIPPEINTIDVDNSGMLSKGIEDFISVLSQISSHDISPEIVA